MLCFGGGGRSKKRHQHDERKAADAGPRAQSPTSPSPGQGTGGTLPTQNSNPDVVPDLPLGRPQHVAAELKKLFQSTGVSPVPAARDNLLVNLSMVQLLPEGQDDEKLWASPSGRLQLEAGGSSAAASALSSAGPGPHSRMSVRGASAVPQRGFVRVSSVAHRVNRSSLAPALADGAQTPTATASGTGVAVDVLPGSTLQPPADAAALLSTTGAQPPASIAAADSELSASQNRALNWTASRRALAVLVVREEQLSRNDKKLATLTHERRLAERLERLNLETIHIEGDGNCQFRTLAHELLGSQQFHQEIRDKVIAHIRQHKEEYECFLGEDFHAYVESMAKSRTWGDELTLRAACDALKVTVNVLTSDASNWYILYEPTVPVHEPREVFCAYNAPIHYFAIKRRSSLRHLSKTLSSSFKRLANSGQLKGAGSLELKSSPM